MNSELPHYYHYSQRRPCATPATWLSELSLRCRQHDDEHCHLEAASHLDDAGLHASVACSAALQRRRRRKSSWQLQWHFTALSRTSRVPCFLHSSTGGLSKRLPTAESIATDHRKWPEESKPGVSTMEALLLSSQSRSSSSAATASLSRLQKVLSRPTSSTACEG